MTNQKFKKTEIEKIFGELQANGLINKKSKLKCRNSEANFRGMRNKIYYNPVFVNNKKDTLRFFLLHEEAHNVHFQNSNWVLGSGLILALVSYYFFRNFFYSMGIFFAIFFIFRRFISKDEINSDLYASEKLKVFYKINKPSKVFKEAIEELRKKNKERRILSKISSKIIKFLGYHPPIEERIKIIKRAYG
jgi:Zn-dependent protease with chaperone function